MKQHRLRITYLAAAITAVPLLVQAQQIGPTDEPAQPPAGPGFDLPSFGQTPPQGDLFGDLDSDGDDIISRPEALRRPELGNRFDAFDRDLSGGLSPGEFSAFEQEIGPGSPRTAPGFGTFDRLDQDRDGVLNQQEAMQSPGLGDHQFGVLDRDRSGGLTTDEFSAFEQGPVRDGLFGEPPPGTGGLGEPPPGTGGIGEPPPGTTGIGEPPPGTSGFGAPSGGGQQPLRGAPNVGSP